MFSLTSIKIDVGMAHITWVLKTHCPTEARALRVNAVTLLSSENCGFRGEAFRVWMEADFAGVRSWR